MKLLIVNSLTITVKNVCENIPPQGRSMKLVKNYLSINMVSTKVFLTKVYKYFLQNKGNKVTKVTLLNKVTKVKSYKGNKGYKGFLKKNHKRFVCKTTSRTSWI